MRTAALVCLVALLLAAAPRLTAEEPAAAGLARDLIGEPAGEPLAGDALDQRTEEVSSLMRCPVCQGLSVADSPTTSALAMREEARDLLAVGYTEEQVLSYFERSYGEFIRLSPKPEGFNLVVWILPVAALLAGLLVVGARMRSKARAVRRSESPASGAEESAGESAESSIPDDLAAYAERVRREVEQ